MQEMFDKIDAFLNEIAALSIWDYVKEMIQRIRAVLKLEGEDDAVEFIDAMS